MTIPDQTPGQIHAHEDANRPLSLPRSTLGRTRRPVTRIGLGGAFLSQQSTDEGIRLVRHALSLGINYIDTSPMYLKGRSQGLIGEALAGARLPENFTLATKLGYLQSPIEHRNPDALLAQFEDNQRLLGRRIDLLQLHEADLSHWWIDPPLAEYRIRKGFACDFQASPAWSVLSTLKAQGRVGMVGVTGNDNDAMCLLLDNLPLDSLLLAFNYTLIRRKARQYAVPQAHKTGVAMLVGGVLDCGNLARPFPQWLSDRPKWMPVDEVPRFKALYDLSGRTGLSLVELAVRFLLADERVDVILLGPSSRIELDEICEAAARGPLDGDLLASVEGLP
jgi:L-galactose dehydrogenase